jgi:hypothetical protein
MEGVQSRRTANGFILITGIEGTRYAVRQNAVAVIHDADECRDETIVQLHGGHVVRVPCPLEEVLAWSVEAHQMRQHRFGGSWTVNKLDALRAYLSGYAQALKNQPFSRIYIDAFAGTGERSGEARSRDPDGDPGTRRNDERVGSRCA